MSAGIFNITIEKRSTFSFQATFTESNGSALDLTDRTLSGEIRRDYDNALQATFTIVKTDAAAGIATISLSKAQTSALIAVDSNYDIFADHSDGTSIKLLKGSATISENITSA